MTSCGEVVSPKPRAESRECIEDFVSRGFFLLISPWVDEGNMSFSAWSPVHVDSVTAC